MNIVKPNRAARSRTLRLLGDPETVFPLFCPVREADWVDGWSPVLVASSSGLAEPDCVFTTPASPCDTVWYVTHHEPRSGFIEMLRITPTVTACRLTIQLRGTSEGCDAEVTYAHTSLGPEGDEFVASFTEDYYTRFMHDWESRINHYLRTGEALRIES